MAYQIIDNNSKYIKVGTVVKCQSETVKINDGKFYMVKFARIRWAIFKTKDFDLVLQSYKNGETGSKRALYSIMKDHKHFGVFIPRKVQHGKNEGKMFLMAVSIGKRKIRQYYIFDVDNEGIIQDNAPIVFDVSTDIPYKDRKFNKGY